MSMPIDSQQLFQILEQVGYQRGGFVKIFIARIERGGRRKPSHLAANRFRCGKSNVLGYLLKQAPSATIVAEGYVITYGRICARNGRFK